MKHRAVQTETEEVFIQCVLLLAAEERLQALEILHIKIYSFVGCVLGSHASAIAGLATVVESGGDHGAVAACVVRGSDRNSFQDFVCLFPRLVLIRLTPGLPSSRSISLLQGHLPLLVAEKVLPPDSMRPTRTEHKVRVLRVFEFDHPIAFPPFQWAWVAVLDRKSTR